jgi:putative DNA primase/helicase
MRPQLRDQAQGRWRAILPKLGVSAKALDGKQHPCPVCAGTDRFRFDDLDGHGTWFCNVCGAGNGMSLAMAMTGLPFADMAAKVREMLPDAPVTNGKPPRDDARCTQAMREVWTSSVAISGTMAEAYLRSRGCWSDATARLACLRFAPRLIAKNHEAGFLPALIAKVTDLSGQAVNIHRTFLVDGRKAYRAMMPGPIPAGAAIRLGSASDRLGIAEGLETSLRAALRFGVPCWSSISAGGMERWAPPAGVARVEIFGDSDRSYSGQASAYILARKLTNQRQPIACGVHLPDAIGTDWADEDPMLERAA